MKRWIHRHIGRRVDQLAAWAEPAIEKWRWIPAALAIGIVPFALSLAAGLPGHQMVSGVLLAWLCLACTRSDRWQKGMGLLALAFAAHSLAVILASSYWPQRCAGILPGAETYWQQQLAWITTGEDPEYALHVWLLRHAQLIGMSVLWSFLTLGVQTLGRGFLEVDLMNYYNAQLWINSVNPPLTLILGWHVWSVLRGVGFLFLSYEMISLALQCWTGSEVAPWKRRRLRLGVALAFFIADGITKHWLLEVVRQGLHDNLLLAS